MWNNKCGETINIRNLTEIALLIALITITGTVKLPGLVPGTEFQLSAPLAVAICAIFGFKRYITAGVLASVISLTLGTSNLLNVFIAMVFRLTVGGLLTAFGTSWPVVSLAGPVGSAVARLALGGLLGKAVIPLVIAAIPGMIYTAIAAWPLTLLLGRVKRQTEKVMNHAIQR
ncbi:hypothetical protein EV210_109127 [Anaerospora hongkongensis]|uniref:Uncharacterized protein n=1 Tax=Anaerospora hongkongensis TaxID=244830 RepID=A0A4R1PWY4_9FIRM|nr:hypothetical protein [Anaerospora hongkongensis]TCL36178.1 hypothetical protein EV210_109127 [Anaerospora hongkongensis]